MDKHRPWRRMFTLVTDMHVTAELRGKKKTRLWLGGAAAVAAGGAVTYVLWQRDHEEKDTGFPRPPGRP
jgi:hypothetical protein